MNHLIEKLKNDIPSSKSGNSLAIHSLMLYMLIDRLTVLETSNTWDAPTEVKRSPNYDPDPKLWNFDLLGNWSNLLQSIRLQASQRASQDQNESSNLSPMCRRLNTIDTREKGLNFDCILQNMDKVALNLMILQHAHDIPNDEQEFNTVLSAFPKQDRKALHSAINKRAPYWRTPLYFSLCIGPLVLLLGQRFHKANRYNMIAAWIALGNVRPPELLEVEDTLWRELLDMAFKNKSAEEALQSFLSSTAHLTDNNPFPFILDPHTKQPELPATSAKTLPVESNLLEAFTNVTVTPTSD
ncbi:hypothetical protein VNI00_017835 [Paramarasmius palmivorus]|uniref:Uncharacterized protein n=1 Tax=Paramarasmius palmivorus TaxID=297713 RepID=A0AAW0B2B6_9AGAR